MSVWSLHIVMVLLDMFVSHTCELRQRKHDTFVTLVWEVHKLIEYLMNRVCELKFSQIFVKSIYNEHICTVK
jgi:hypothetical protein